jgi:hypothetical protein
MKHTSKTDSLYQTFLSATGRSAIVNVFAFAGVVFLAWLASVATASTEVEQIPWERVIGLLYKGEVAKATPKEGLDLQLTLKDGSRVRAEEPHAGAFVEEVQKCGPPCVDILVG